MDGMKVALDLGDESDIKVGVGYATFLTTHIPMLR